MGARDRETNRINAEVTHKVDTPALTGFISRHTKKGATVYTDDASAYLKMKDMKHVTVRHSTGK